MPNESQTNEEGTMVKHMTATAFLSVLTWAFVSPGASGAERAGHFPLTSPDGLLLENTSVQAATLHGKQGLRVVMADDALARVRGMSAAERQRASETGQFPEQMAIIDGLEFGNGIIEVEIAGEPLAGVFEGARGFVGIAFRVQKDRRSYDAFYLRPANGRAEEQLRRNRAVQYISHPDWTWFRFRQETPGKYESYVDLVPGEWTRIRIEVQGAQARLYVHGAEQPSLIVNDLKTGDSARGGIALWLDIGTVAHFRNLSVRQDNSDSTPRTTPVTQ
jgi:hypothetical protein